MSGGVRVPAEAAVEAVETLLGSDAMTPNSNGTPDYYVVDVENVRYLVDVVLTAAIPLLREGITAEVLGPVRASLDEYRRTFATGEGRFIGDLLWNDINRHLSDPVQAAEPATEPAVDLHLRDDAPTGVQGDGDDDCASCGEIAGPDCAASQRSCGHHCNHSWEQDICHWCGVTFGEDDVEIAPVQAAGEVDGDE